MLKKWSILVGLCVLLLSVTACNSNEKASSTTATNKAFEANIESASYILTGEDDGVSEQYESRSISSSYQSEKYVKKSINLFYDGIVLYDGEEQLNPIRNAYDSKIDLSI